MTLAEQFGRRLFVERRRQGVSRERLAAAAGLHRATIYLIEHGERDARLTTIVKLADALGVDPAGLVRGLRP